MNKLTEAELKQAAEQARHYLAGRKELLQDLRQDNAAALVEYGRAGLIDCKLEPNGIVVKLTSDQIKKLEKSAESDFTAWDILQRCVAANPDDKRLNEFRAKILSGQKPPKKKRGRKPEVMRDYFILCAIARLLDAGLNIPSVGENTRTKYNSAYVLAELLVSFGVALSPDTICDIWDKREQTFEQATAAATVLRS